MKRLRTWAWPDPLSVSKRVNQQSFGSGFWKHKQIRKQLEFIARQIAQQLCNPSFVMVRTTAGEAEEAPAPAPAAVVVH